MAEVVLLVQGPSWHADEDVVSRAGGQGGIVVLRAVEFGNGPSQRGKFGAETWLLRVPHADDELRFVRKHFIRHERGDLLPFLVHGGDHAQLGRVLDGVLQFLVSAFLLLDLMHDIERLDIHGDGVVSQIQVGELAHHPGEGCLAEAFENEHTVVVAIEAETEIGFA